jgi:hypothetical protein
MLKRAPIVDTVPTHLRPNAVISPKKDLVNLESKLQRLEQLQYALTKQVTHCSLRSFIDATDLALQELENRKRAHQITDQLQQQRPVTAPDTRADSRRTNVPLFLQPSIFLLCLQIH